MKATWALHGALLRNGLLLVEDRFSNSLEKWVLLVAYRQRGLRLFLDLIVDGKKEHLVISFFIFWYGDYTSISSLCFMTVFSYHFINNVMQICW